jgi:hypothetical protein
MILIDNAPMCACGRQKERVRAGKRKPQGEWRCRHCFREYQRAYHRRKQLGIPTESKELAEAPVEIPVCDCGAKKTLHAKSGARPPAWVCVECNRKRKLAAKRDRDELAGGAIAQYWAAERRWRP